MKLEFQFLAMARQAILALTMACYGAPESLMIFEREWNRIGKGRGQREKNVFFRALPE